MPRPTAALLTPLLLTLALTACSDDRSSKGSDGSGSSAASPAPADTPEASYAAFTESIKAGDTGAVQTFVVGGGDDEPAFEGMIEMLVKLRTLQEKVETAHGEPAAKLLANSPLFKGVPKTEELDPTLYDITTEGDTATVKKKEPEPDGTDLKLVKQDGKWYVDATSMFEGEPDVSAKQMARAVPIMNQALDEAIAVADTKPPAELLQQIMTKVQQGMAEVQPQPADGGGE